MLPTIAASPPQLPLTQHHDDGSIIAITTTTSPRPPAAAPLVPPEPPSIKEGSKAMSIQQYHTNASLSDAWRTINIDALTEDSSANFDVSTLAPPQPETTEDEVRQISGQVRQLLRGGDAEGALRGALDTPVYNGTDAAKDAHLQTIIEVLQSIKASDMSPLLKSIYGSPGGSEALDVLMKYMHVYHSAPSREEPQLTS
ncbi:hypothetical protein S7711_06168 [Stachybotrys chartarum IBT 7711]|uniref:Actin-related protein 2/3 complex subunit 5 n=1 Tax=Stachybotrys chartarum (strain CBS 109288 / IBT 7711) TaxID=1280523 RepID=A0A084AM96_STACB|nr:hypothetical protein S7711_06168 [Stachybotrys chartarum IBT 7711]